MTISICIVSLIIHPILVQIKVIMWYPINSHTIWHSHIAFRMAGIIYRLSTVTSQTRNCMITSAFKKPDVHSMERFAYILETKKTISNRSKLYDTIIETQKLADSRKAYHRSSVAQSFNLRKSAIICVSIKTLS